MRNSLGKGNRRVIFLQFFYLLAIADRRQFKTLIVIQSFPAGTSAPLSLTGLFTQFQALSDCD